MNKEFLSRKIRAGRYIAITKRQQMKVGVIQKYENFRISIRWNDDQETVQEVSLTSILHNILWIWDSSENQGETKCSEKISAGSKFVCPMSSLQCPISYTTLKHPVTSIYGHTYERDQIHQWLEKEETCPITRKPLQADQLFPNFILKDIIQNMQDNFETRRCSENITNEIIRQVYDNNFESANRLIEGIEVSTIPHFNSWSYLYSITKMQHPEINQSILKLQDRLFKHVEGMKDGLCKINQKKDEFVSLQKQLSQERENIQMKIGECEEMLKMEMSRLDEMKSEVQRQEESVRRAESDLATTNQKIQENHENIKQITEMLGKCDEDFQELENKMILTQINIEKCF
jgi:FtsZ-binding cell division protein ZapB